MIKPADWDTAEAFTGEFKTLKPGGYICKILGAKTETTRTGKEQLIIMFDIAEGEFKGFYKEQHEKKFATNPNAQWLGVYRQLTGGESEKTNPFFKGMIISIEHSNSGYIWNWQEQSLKGKLFGGVFGQEEYLNNSNEKKVATKLMYIRSVDQIRNGVEIPAIKKLQPQNGGFNDFAGSFGSDTFPTDDDNPFF